MNPVVRSVINAIIENSEEKIRISSFRFFKDEVNVRGVGSAMVTEIARDYFREISSLPKQEIFSLCEELFGTGYLEDSFVACNWSYRIHKTYESGDFAVFESWVGRYVSNWATCDTLCNHSVGTLVEMYPSKIQDLKKMAHSPGRWMRRASAVSLIVQARKGLFLDDIFEIAGILLRDSDDMVRKGYGWMLKAASQAHQKEVFDFVYGNRAEMPRTALRYAIEKMPPELKKLAMAR